MIQPPDLRQVTVLTKAEWLRIQDEINQVNKDKERMREGAKQRETLHLQSKEVVKLWSNTIAVSCLYRFYVLVRLHNKNTIYCCNMFTSIKGSKAKTARGKEASGGD